MSHQEIGGRTEEQAQRSRLTNELTRQYKLGVPGAQENLMKAFQEGLISHANANVIVNSELTPLQRMVKGMTFDEAKRVYSKATPEEKAQLAPMIERKEANKEKEFATPLNKTRIKAILNSERSARAGVKGDPW